MERTMPNSLRDKYTDDRMYLYHLLWSLEDAVMNLSSGTVASYSLGNRSVNYQDLDRLKMLMHETEERINEIEARLRGASARNITVSTFLDPSLVLPHR